MNLWYPPILAYHRVHPTAGSDTPSLSPEAFERQMSLLEKRWRPIPLSTLVDWLEGKQTLAPKAVVVTFDDGTDDHFSYAYPILKRHGIPATVFMITGNVGLSGFLSPKQIRQMGQGGITFGSHTFGHAYLPSLTPPEIRKELESSKKQLEDLGLSIDFLSYPAGGFTQAVIQSAQEAGYRAACTTNRGFRRFPIDRWALRRITMHGNATSSLGLWVRCCGYYNLNRRLRHPYSPASQALVKAAPLTI